MGIHELGAVNTIITVHHGSSSSSPDQDPHLLSQSQDVITGFWIQSQSPKLFLPSLNFTTSELLFCIPKEKHPYLSPDVPTTDFLLSAQLREETE